MLDRLATIATIEPKTPRSQRALALHAVAYALKNQKPKELREALDTVVHPIKKEEWEFLRENTINSDWPLGFEWVSGHCALGAASATTKAEAGGVFMLLAAAKGMAYKLVEHLWRESPEEVKARCLSEYMELNLAKCLVRLGETERIRVNARSIVVGRTIEALMGNSTKEEHDEIKVVLKSMLEGQTGWSNFVLWREVCKFDDVALLRELIREGVISSENLSSRVEVGRVKSSVESRGEEDRVSKALINGSESAQGGKEFRTFSFAEIISLSSGCEHKILAVLLGDPEFRQDLLSSPIALHALTAVACESAAYGASDILGELKAHGVNLGAVKRDNESNPLHLYADRYVNNGGESALEFIKIAQLYPDWILAKDDSGQVAMDLVPVDYQEQTLPEIEAIVLREEVSKIALRKVSKIPRV